MLVLLGLVMLQAPPGSDWNALRVRIEMAPQEVATFIERRAGCNHFSGEESYDRQRAEEIGRALRKLRCTDIESDERALRQIYHSRPIILQLLDDTRDLLGW